MDKIEFSNYEAPEEHYQVPDEPPSIIRTVIPADSVRPSEPDEPRGQPQMTLQTPIDLAAIKARVAAAQVATHELGLACLSKADERRLMKISDFVRDGGDLVAEVERLAGMEAKYNALRAVAWEVAESDYKWFVLGHAMSNLRAALEDIDYFVREGFWQSEVVGAVAGLGEAS